MLSHAAHLLNTPPTDNGNLIAALIGAGALIAATFLAWGLSRIRKSQRDDKTPTDRALSVATFSGTAATEQNKFMALVVADNESLRNDLKAFKDETNNKFKTLLSRTQVLGDGFVAMSTAVERNKVKLTFEGDEKTKIDAARAAMASDIDWPTAIPSE